MITMQLRFACIALGEERNELEEEDETRCGVGEGRLV